MTNKQLAVYALIASAFVLGGMLTFRVASHLESTAQAELVVNKGDFTVLSTAGFSNEDYLYVLDNSTEMLVMYTFRSGRIEHLTLDVGKVFEQNLKAIQSGGGGRRR